MKKKGLALLLAGMMILASGCGSSSMMTTESAVAENSAAMDTAYAGSQYEEVAEEDVMDSGSGVISENGLEAQVENGRKLIRTIDLSLQTTDFDSVLSDLSAKTTELGGYIESSSVSGNNYYYQSTRYASYTIRIPSDQLDQFVTVVSDLGNVTQKNESVDDVTLQYVDVESRKKALETEQERLLELLAQVENMEDLLAIESKLSDVRYELENYGSQLRMLDNQIDYSTVNVNVDEVERVTDTGEKSFFGEIKDRFGNSLYTVGRDIRGFIIVVLGSLPILIVWAVIIVIVVLAVKKIRKRRKQKKEEQKKEE